MLHGNIRDFVINPESQEEYIPFQGLLCRALNERDLVMFYNVASGLWFLRQDMESQFRRLAELDQGNSAPADPVAAAVATAKGDLAQKRPIPRDPDLCLPLVEKVLRRAKRAALVIDSVHAIAPSSNGGAGLNSTERTNVIRLKNWAQSTTLRKNNALVIMLTEQASDVSPELRSSSSGIKTIYIAKPSKEDRLSYINFAYGENNINPNDLDPMLLANATQGMSFKQILEIFLRGKQAQAPINLEYVKQKKQEILNEEYGDIMEIVDPKRGLEDIGGLGYIKAFFQEMLEAIRQGEDRLVSMGVTLMGPPGTGKTALVEALAKEAGFNFVKVKNVRSMWVGESEARMERLIQGLKTLAPVVVMNDEADLANADRNAPKGDSGVSERLMKMWMELLSDTRIRGQIVVISCTNRPDRIDPALKRSGRSDERILVPMPTATELPDIFRVMIARYKIPTDLTDFTSFAKLTEGLSGADIEKIVLNSYRFGLLRGNKIDEQALEEAIADFIPSASQAEIDRMTLMGILECSSRRLLPPNLRAILSSIQERNLVDNLGEIINLIKARNIAEI